MPTPDRPGAVLHGDTIAVARQKMRRLIEHGFKARQRHEDGGLDARLLLAHHLQLSRSELIAAADRPVTAVQATALMALAVERGTGVPVARLVGETEFWSLPFYLSAETLVPRQDSELLVEAALSRIGDQVSHILDIGTGSGCLALAILSERPAASALGTDISSDALKTARRNADRLHLTDRFSTRLSDVFDGLQDSDPFDLILSNPPYIASAVIDGLDSEVRDHDPRGALDGGVDGLEFYRRLATQSAAFLRPEGYLIVEIGFDQAVNVAALLHQAGYRSEVLRDLAGHPRVLIGQKIVRKH
uniref:peptide chain release factor N(5)-glutamine methyltransferase n=1 Tax=Pararhizobium sp. IMCC3301 TaxID=3067904 RepID=UPI002742443E|nr:peptide chain release factor N(5)-glutamine methyltransferase [Pararhizobium sp. IMCC3301]